MWTLDTKFWYDSPTETIAGTLDLVRREKGKRTTIALGFAWAGYGTEDTQITFLDHDSRPLAVIRSDFNPGTDKERACDILLSLLMSEGKGALDVFLTKVDGSIDAHLSFKEGQPLDIELVQKAHGDLQLAPEAATLFESLFESAQ